MRRILLLFLLLFKLPAIAVGVTDGVTTLRNFKNLSFVNGTVANVGNGTASITIDLTTDTNANTICSGSTTYLDGEGNCDNLSSVYQPLDSDLTAISGLSFAANGDLITTSGSSIIRLAKGSDNQVLTMSGNLINWENAAGGGSEWTDNGVNLYPNEITDNVSIGHTFNEATLNIDGDISLKSITTPTLDMMGDFPRVYVKTSTSNLTFLKWDGMSQTEYDLVKGSTAVQGPGSSTDTAVVLWDGTAGDIIQDSVVLISSMGNITGADSLTLAGSMSNPLVVSTSKLVVDSSGNVGINDSSPSYQLDVNGISRFTDHLSLSNNKYISFADSGAMGDNTVLGVDSSDNVVLKSFDLMMGGSAPIIFKSKTSAGESMRLDTNGYLGINTTGANTYSHIYANNTDTTTTLARFEQDSTGDASVTFTLTSTENWAMGIDNSDSDKFKISRSEDLGTDPKLVISSSDITITNNGAFNQSAYFDAEVDDGNSSTADTIDWRTGNHHKSTMTGNCTYTFTAPAGATTLTLKLVQDGTGSRLATWPASVKWPGNTDPTLSTGSADIDFVSCYYDGTNYYCQFGANFE